MTGFAGSAACHSLVVSVLAIVPSSLARSQAVYRRRHSLKLVE
jgi:hypothetical protein